LHECLHLGDASLSLGFAPAVKDFSAAVDGVDGSDAASAMDCLPAAMAIRGAPAAPRNTRLDSIVIPSSVGGPNTSGASIL